MTGSVEVAPFVCANNMTFSGSADNLVVPPGQTCTLQGATISHSFFIVSLPSP
jgi:hypothetical protein